MKLTREDIRDAMSGISEQLITEAAEGSREIRERRLTKLLSVTAAVVLVSVVAVSAAFMLRKTPANTPEEPTDGTTSSSPGNEEPPPYETHVVTANIDGYDIQISSTARDGDISSVDIVSPPGISAKLADTCGQYYKKMILEIERRGDDSYEKFCVEVDITTGEVNDFMRECSYEPSYIDTIYSWQIMLPNGIQPLTWRYDNSGVVMIAAVVPTNGGWSAYALWAYDSESSTLYDAGLSSPDPVAVFHGSNILILPKNGKFELSSGDGGMYALLWYESPAEYDPQPGEETPPSLTVSKEASTFFDGLPLESTYTVTEDQTLDGTATVEFFYGEDHITHKVNLHTGEITVSSYSDRPETAVEVKTEYDGKPLTVTYTETNGNITGVGFEPSAGYSFEIADRSGKYYDKMVVLITHETDNGVNDRESFAAVLDIRTGEFDDFVRDADIYWPYDDEGMYRTVTWQYNSEGAVMIALADAESEGRSWDTVFAMWTYDQRTDMLERAEMDQYVGENIRLFNEIGAESFARYAILWRVQNEDGLVDIVLEACEALDLFTSGGMTVPAHDVSIESAVDWRLTVEVKGVEYTVDLITGEVKEKISSDANETTVYIDGEPVKIYWDTLQGYVIVDYVVCTSGDFKITQWATGGKKVLIGTSLEHFALCDLETGKTDEFGSEYLKRTPGSDMFTGSIVKSNNGNFIYALYVSCEGDIDPHLHAAYRFDLTDGSLKSCEFGGETYLRTSSAYAIAYGGAYAIAYGMTKDGVPVNAAGLDTFFSAPGTDGYIVSDSESYGEKVARIELTDTGDVYFIDLRQGDAPYSLIERQFRIKGGEVTVVWHVSTDGWAVPIQTPTSADFEYDVFNISGNGYSGSGYALVKIPDTGECYLVGTDGAVIGGAEKIFAAVGCELPNCYVSSDVGTQSMIVSVDDTHEVNGCTLTTRDFYITYKTSGGEITDTEAVELSALPELAESFAVYAYAKLLSSYRFDGDGCVAIDVCLCDEKDDILADNFAAVKFFKYDPGKGEIVSLDIRDSAYLGVNS